MYEMTNQEILSLLQLIRMLENWNRGFYSFRHFIFTKVSGYDNTNENNASSTNEFASAFVEETDGDSAKIKLSYAHADRSQRKVKQNLL